MTCRDRLISGINILCCVLELWNGLVNIWKWIKPPALAIIQVIWVFFSLSSVQQLCSVSAEALSHLMTALIRLIQFPLRGEVVCFIGLFYKSNPQNTIDKYVRTIKDIKETKLLTTSSNWTDLIPRKKNIIVLSFLVISTQVSEWVVLCIRIILQWFHQENYLISICNEYLCLASKAKSIIFWYSMIKTTRFRLRLSQIKT